MESHVSSAAAFVEGGIQDACDDACSICLEAFSETDPSTVTCCKHDYHLQCVLEWCQRSSQCPMCWQTISLKDPTSQELLEAVERERNIRVNLSHNTNIFHHMSLGDFGLQHLPSADGHPQVLVFSSDPNISSFSSVHRGSANEPMIGGIGVNPFRSNVTAAEMPHLSSTQSFAGQSSSHNQDRAGPFNFNSLSETLKSRLTSASMRYRDSITRSTLEWRERFFARNASMSDLGSEVMREVNAGIATVSRIMERLDLREHNTRSASAQQSIQGHAVAETTQTSNERVAVNRNVSAFCSASSDQN